jgi:hypothetical protein
MGGFAYNYDVLHTSFLQLNLGFMTTPPGLLNHLTIFPGLLLYLFKASSHEGHA